MSSYSKYLQRTNPKLYVRNPSACLHTKSLYVSSRLQTLGGNSLRVCSCRNSHGAFTISLLPPKASLLRFSAPFICVFLLPRILLLDDWCGGSDSSPHHTQLPARWGIVHQLSLTVCSWYRASSSYNGLCARSSATVLHLQLQLNIRTLFLQCQPENLGEISCFPKIQW